MVGHAHSLSSQHAQICNFCVTVECVQAVWTTMVRVLSILSTTAMCGYGERRMRGLAFPELTFVGDDLWMHDEW